MKRSWAALCVVLCGMVGIAAADHPLVRVNEIMYAPYCGPEWVELYNYGTEPEFLAGYLLTDNEGIDLNEGEYWFPAGVVIEPDDYLVIAYSRTSSGCTNSPSPDLTWKSIRLANTGDGVFVVRDAGDGLFIASDIVDQVDYSDGWGGEKNGYTIAIYCADYPVCEQGTDGEWEESISEGGSPGYANDMVRFYVDRDLDTFGNPSEWIMGFSDESPPYGYVLNGLDCSDTRSDINPAASESCNDTDDDCDRSVDEGCDDDGDDYCDSGMKTVGAPSKCPLGGGDCKDTDSSINPAALEKCDSIDNDCDNGQPGGGIDEGCPQDKDGDGYCVDQTIAASESSSSNIGLRPDHFPDLLPGRTVDISATCVGYESASCDADSQINPGQSEKCDTLGKDENCNGASNENCSRRVHLCGNIVLNDDESWPWSDETRTVSVNTFKDVNLSIMTERYHLDECVGDEVRLVYDLSLTLAYDASVTADGNATVYEGTACDTTDYDSSKDWGAASIAVGRSIVVDDKLEESGDYADFNLTIYNLADNAADPCP